MQTGLAAAAALWTPVAAAYDWVFRAAAILANLAGRSGAAVKASYPGLLGAMTRHAAGAGNLAGALRHFRKVTRSYWSGLFHCYDVADLPGTDNDLEQLFGSHRDHERRCSGRNVASPGLVVGGSGVCQRRWRRGSGANSGAKIWHPRIWEPGGICVPAWSAVRKCGPKAAASAAIRTHIFNSLKTF